MTGRRSKLKWERISKEAALEGGPARLRITVKGRVQGVGFRPHVYRLAVGSGLAGNVRNTRLGVIVEVEGSLEALDVFGRSLVGEPPPLARIDSLEVAEVEPLGAGGFRILGSEGPGAAETLFPVDTAVCGDCLREMRDPEDRRFRYPFINCTNCGPRFTIVEGLPYDRPLTTMKEFSMDGFCRAQYRNPADRRYHAEPVSCPRCGPRLSTIDSSGGRVPGDPVEAAVRLIAGGAIVAVKGLGGYHLACLAEDPAVVECLRSRKKRPAKPFALMFRDMEEIGKRCFTDEEERRLLTSPETPIVLLRRRCSGLPAGIAPGNGYLGAMLPYTPLHHLLMESFEVLVMTSANFTDEPLISNETELEAVLDSIADAAVVHDRRIAHKCDDSIFFLPAGKAVPVRRARGFVPEPVLLPHPSRAGILALGGNEKGTFTLTRGEEAFLSPHLGDLTDFRSQVNYRKELEEFQRLLDVRPTVCAHDMHPDYFTTRLAGELDAAVKIPVQHHHAHAVGVMTEYALKEPVLAVTFDGTGFGGDGKLWGGEFLLAGYADFTRLAHFKYLPLPGGEAAIREPWRMSLVHIWNVLGESMFDEDLPAACGFGVLPAAKVLELARKGINSPLSSSVGRLFDAVACMLGCGRFASYEAEAAVALESLALEAREVKRVYRFGRSAGVSLEIDPGPVVAAVLDDLSRGLPPEEISAAFHGSLAGLVVGLSEELAERHGCDDVVLSGGVFQNRVLCENVMGLAESSSLRFYMHEVVPPNDGGVSLGQAQVAAAMIERGLVREH